VRGVQVDPSQLKAPSPGKLVRYTVPDGSTLAPDQPYAEVEVLSRCSSVGALFDTASTSECALFVQPLPGLAEQCRTRVH